MLSPLMGLLKDGPSGGAAIEEQVGSDKRPRWVKSTAFSTGEAEGGCSSWLCHLSKEQYKGEVRFS